MDSNPSSSNGLPRSGASSNGSARNGASGNGPSKTGGSGNGTSRIGASGNGPSRNGAYANGSSRRYRRRANAERNWQVILRAGIIGAYCVVLLVAGLYLGYKGRTTPQPAPASIPAGSQSEDSNGSVTTVVPAGDPEPQAESSVTATTGQQDPGQSSSASAGNDAAGAHEGIPEGAPEGTLQGAPEGTLQGTLEASPDGTPEGTHEAELVTAPATAPAVQETPVWPVEGEVVDGSRWVFSEYLDEWRHLPGVEIAVIPGTPVTASMTGKVVSVHTDPDLGTVVTLEHVGGVTTEYGRLSGCILGVGDTVRQGEEIARTGGTTLYFGTSVNGEAVSVAEILTP